MECLRCKSYMKKGFVNFNGEILTGPNQNNLVINGEVAAVRSIYVCPCCGYIELNYKEFYKKQQGYDVNI